MLLPRLRFVTVSALCAILAGPLVAQGAPNTGASTGVETASEGGLQDVVVTAQRRAESAQDVPIAITTLSEDSLSAIGVNAIIDLNTVTPGLSISTGSGAFVLPRIRGVGTSTGAPGRENPVAVYVDDVYIASASASTFSFNSISQVAVLKGPQGTLFGRNATGGLIQITTADPAKDFSAKASATVGNLETFGGSLYLTGGLTENVAADVSAYYNDQGEGFGRNTVTGEDVNKARSYAIRSKLKAAIGADTSLTLIGDYSNLSSYSGAYRTVTGTVTSSGTTFTGGKFDYDGRFNPISESKQGGGSLTLDHDFGDIRFKSITAYRRAKLFLRLDGDGYDDPFGFDVDVSYTSDEDQLTQEFQLMSDQPGPFQWTTGLYYFRSNGEMSPCLCVVIGHGALSFLTEADYKTTSYAAYAQGTYALTDRLNFTAGLRDTEEKRSVDGVLTATQFGAVAVIPSANSDKLNKLTWRLSMDYRPSPEVLAYVSYNRGFKSGGFNAAEVPYTESVKPEVVDAYETGLKLDLLDRRLRINPSVFYYDYANLQASVFVNSASVTRNATSAEIYGIDLDAVAKITDYFSISGGFSLLRTKTGLFENAAITIPLPNGGNLQTSGDIRGKRVPYSPKSTINISPEFRFPVGLNEIIFTGNYYRNSGYFTEPENRTRQPSYDLFGGSVEYRFSDHRYSVELWGKNLGNTAYALQIAAQASSDIVVVGPGRSYGLTLKTEF